MLSELTECSSTFREQQDFRKIYYPQGWRNFQCQRRNMFSLAIRKEPTTFALLKGTT